MNPEQQPQEQPIDDQQPNQLQVSPTQQRLARSRQQNNSQSIIPDATQNAHNRRQSSQNRPITYTRKRTQNHRYQNVMQQQRLRFGRSISRKFEGPYSDNADNRDDERDDTTALIRRNRSQMIDTSNSPRDTSTMLGIPRSYYHGLAWCVVFGICRGGMYSSQKIAQSVAQIQWEHLLLIRSFVMMMGAYFHGKVYDQDHSQMGYKQYKDLSIEAKWTVWLRSIYGFGSFLAAMISIFLMPVSVSVSITMTATFVTALIAYLIEGEALSKRELSTIFVGFIGVLMIVNPGWFNTTATINKRIKNDDKQYPYYYLGAFFGVVFAVLSAMNFITIRQMSANMYVSMKTYYFGVISTGVSLLICLVVTPKTFNIFLIGTNEYPLTYDSLQGCLIIGFFSWVSQDAMSVALGIVKSGTVAGFYNLSLVISFMTDTIYFKRVLVWSDYSGAAIIILCTTLQSVIANMDHEESVKAQQSEFYSGYDTMLQSRQPGQSPYQESDLQIQTSIGGRSGQSPDSQELINGNSQRLLEDTPSFKKRNQA